MRMGTKVNEDEQGRMRERKNEREEELVLVSRLMEGEKTEGSFMLSCRPIVATGRTLSQQLEELSVRIPVDSNRRPLVAI